MRLVVVRGEGLEPSHATSETAGLPLADPRVMVSVVGLATMR